MKLEELTIDVVEAAYAKHGRRPTKEYTFTKSIHETYDAPCGVCPLVIMSIELFGDGKYWHKVIDRDVDCDGFYSGFDGTYVKDWTIVTKAGVDLGAAMRKHFIEESNNTNETK